VFKSSEAFSGFSVDDIDAAYDFYSNTLGLEVDKETMGTLGIKLGSGQHVMAYPKPNHEPATFTILNFVTSDIDQTVDDLVAKGVQMERYDNPEMAQDERGIARDERGPAIAWFKDPAGNILSVLEQ
jgi:catechol 2,3-dioxygenase-like lactoylglutathione lyase family enzyme